jgi:hypothetical protein
LYPRRRIDEEPPLTDGDEEEREVLGAGTT